MGANDLLGIPKKYRKATVLLQQYTGLGSSYTNIPQFTFLYDLLRGYKDPSNPITNTGVFDYNAGPFRVKCNGTEGASITILEDGLYSFTFNYGGNASNVYAGITLNEAASDLTTACSSLNFPPLLVRNYSNNTSIGSVSCSFIGWFRARDIVRPHVDSAPSSNTLAVSFAASFLLPDVSG